MHTKVRFEECPIDHHTVVALETTLRGGLIAHLVDTFSRVGISVRKLESRMIDDTWIQRVVVASPHGENLDDELRAAVLATIEAVALDQVAGSEEAEASSGTFRIAERRALPIESTG